jgi:hypothetical protein
MPIEVAAQIFLFSPQPGMSYSDVIEYLRAREQDEGTAQTVETKFKEPFTYNHLHDLESLWWVAVWIAFYNYFSEGTPSRDRPSFTFQDAANQLELARTLFPPVSRTASRDIDFRHPCSFLDTCDRLPHNKKVIYVGLDLLRLFLIKDYMNIEAGYPLSVDPNSANDEIYDAFTRVFSHMKTVSHDLVLDFIPSIYVKLWRPERTWTVLR